MSSYISLFFSSTHTVQIILFVQLSAAIVSHGRQSRSLRIFGKCNTKDSTVTYINLTQLPEKHMVITNDRKM